MNTHKIVSETISVNDVIGKAITAPDQDVATIAIGESPFVFRKRK